jgi:hypothetical protein
MGAGDTPEKTFENAAAGLRQQIKYAPDDVSVQERTAGKACAWLPTAAMHDDSTHSAWVCLLTACCAVPCCVVLAAVNNHP